MSNSASPNLLESLSITLSDLVARAAPTLVSVHSHRARSSGFAWRPNLVVTAEEALAEDAEVTVVLPGGETAAAHLVGRDPTTDVAVLRIERDNLQAVTLDTTPVTSGALSVVVGAHEGWPTAALGIVSSAGPAWHSLRGGRIDARIELDASLKRSAEGGLALDAAGRAVGMAVFGPRRRILVIPSATIERVAAQLESHGRVTRGYLGLGLQPVRLEDRGVGAMVMTIDRDGPGAAAGVRQGDVIVRWNGAPIETVQALIRSLGSDSIGSVVALSILRAGEPMDLHLTIGERLQS
jgi:S1-C subfamily serine protease